MVDNQLTAAVEPITKSLNPVISLGSTRQMMMQGKYHVSRYALISLNTLWKSTAVAACRVEGHGGCQGGQPRHHRVRGMDYCSFQHTPLLSATGSISQLPIAVRCQ